MKNIFLGLVIVLAAIAACNPPQSTTGSSTDSTTNTNTTDTTSTGTQRDTSMHR